MSPLRGDIVVLSSCTATKLGRGAEGIYTAESLYAGQQHVRLMRGVRTYRGAGQPAGPLKLRIVSAGHGVLAASSRVAGYDHTFRGLPRDAIRRRARELDVPGRVRRLLGRPYALGLLLLGDDYVEACGLDEDVVLGGPTLAFCSPRVALRLPALDRLRTITLGNAEARRFSCALVGLKGELGGRVLSGLSSSGTALQTVTASRTDVLTWLEHANLIAIPLDANRTRRAHEEF